jgi:signal transduction histidine kinase
MPAKVRRNTASSSHALDLLKRKSRRLSFRKGQIVFREGESSDALYVIEKGSVEISALIGPRERRVLAIFGPGDYFGEIAVIDSKPRSATATTREATALCCISRDKVWRMFEESPRLLVTMMHGFSHRLREFDRRYLQELFQYERLALVGRFAQSIVHDFHSPLSNIGFAADLVSHRHATQKEKAMANAIIGKQVERMTGMISEVLDFTRSSRSRVTLTATSFAQFIDEMVAELRPECSRKSIAVELKTSPPRIRIPLDQHRLPHVFSNLVRNAIDVMPRGGRIILSFALSEHDVIIKVEDTGPGISREMSAHLFEPFFTGKSHGTGLGLSICKRIVEDHKGWISAGNKRGGGAVFTFSLPRNAKP